MIPLPLRKEWVAKAVPPDKRAGNVTGIATGLPNKIVFSVGSLGGHGLGACVAVIPGIAFLGISSKMVGRQIPS